MAVIKKYMNGACSVIVHDDLICPPEEASERYEKIAIPFLKEERARMIRERRKENVPTI